MHTAYDWLTVAAFAGLVVLMLQRSVGDERQRDSLWHYIVPAVSCAVCNYLGNEGQHLAALAVLAVGAAYAWHFLKPLARG